MIILNRNARNCKAAEQNPASTAALRRVAINLRSQRRALRHPAGALNMTKSSAGEMKKGIREEVMNGTFARKAGMGTERPIAMRIAGALLAGALAVGAPAAMAASERRTDVRPEMDRHKIENLQRWVSAGHEEWCKDARLVAMDELRRVAPAFAGNSNDMESLPLDTESASENRAVFVWTSPDGKASYRVTVERFAWLLPIAGEADAIVWVPTHAEIMARR
ncbi:MAG TPA: hypothetical protein VKP58_13560 [Candidatus Acidoferrum sp.]|nr:hypothetical protein [Candidatus Acidoferrum sp.]